MLLGDYRLEIVPDTEFRLDGGAMFGVVPRVLWERVCPPDELNRIRLNMNCTFIDTGRDKVLIETGIGEKWSEKETRMYGIFRNKPFADSLLEITGCRPEDITLVINTHLHFDHAGGNTIGAQQTGAQASRLHEHKVRTNADESTPLSSNSVSPLRGDASGTIALQPQFPNARYLVSQSEFRHAQSPHERDRASYLPDNWQPLVESGQLELMPDEYEPIEGLKIEQVRGHSETMQTWRLDRGGKTVYGFADLIPTRHHVPPAWIMAYDLYPTETLAFKKRFLPLALKENWLCLFYHDFESPLCAVREKDGKIAAEPFHC